MGARRLRPGAHTSKISNFYPTYTPIPPTHWQMTKQTELTPVAMLWFKTKGNCHFLKPDLGVILERQVWMCGHFFLNILGEQWVLEFTSVEVCWTLLFCLPVMTCIFQWLVHALSGKLKANNTVCIMTHPLKPWKVNSCICCHQHLGQ